MEEMAIFAVKLSQTTKIENMKEPQFSFDMLYVPPFTKQRGFNSETLNTVWEPFVFERKKSGVALLDAVVDCLINGGDPRTVAWQNGLKASNLSVMMSLLTGLNLQDFTIKWKVRKISELLRHTNLSLTEVMNRCGYKSITTFSRIVKENLGASPIYFRKNMRQRGDLYKYGL